MTSGGEASCVSVYQSGALVGYAQRLASLAAESRDPYDVACFAAAAILSAAAASEAILSEFVYSSYLSAFTKDFRKAGVAAKYETIQELKSGSHVAAKAKKQKNVPPTKLARDHPDVEELLGYRIAIAHSEPGSLRSRLYATRINADGARWAAQVAQTFAKSIWGPLIPNWLEDSFGSLESDTRGK